MIDWKPGVFVRMKANRDYWGGAPKVDELIFTIYTNNDTLASDLGSGLIQFAGVTPAAFQKLKNDPAKTALFATYQAYDNIGFNCYKGPSRGHPACKDPAFRSALGWAIDTKTIASIAYGGAAVPATSILPVDYWPKDADYHWQPPAGELRTYDPAKANELLDEAGYKDTDGDGIRDYKGKPIKLRLWASNERGALGMAGKLVAGYLMKVGLKIEYQSMDPAAMNEGVYAYKDGKYNPDYDMFCWGWAGDYDPGFLLSLLTTSQIEGWSDTGWSNESTTASTRRRTASSIPPSASSSSTRCSRSSTRSARTSRPSTRSLARSTTASIGPGGRACRPSLVASTTAGRSSTSSPRPARPPMRAARRASSSRSSSSRSIVAGVVVWLLVRRRRTAKLELD